MDIKKLQTLVIDALEDVKAQDIRLYDTVELTSLFDRLVIASGTSNRQTKALAASVRDKVKSNGGTILSIEGEGTGEWVLVDLGDMVVHIMQPAIRDYYRLEEIWGEKEVKFGSAKRAVKRIGAEPEEEEEAPKKRGRHLTTSRATTEVEETPKKAPARKTAASASKPASKTATKTASKTATKTATKTAAKTARTAAVKTTAVKAAPAKTATKTATKTAAKTPAAKTVAKTSAVKSAASKTAAPRKTAASAAKPVKVTIATRKAPPKKSPAKKAS